MQIIPSLRQVAIFGLFVAIYCSGILPMSAQTWNGGGADNNWSTLLNWTGPAPVDNASVALTFSGSTRLNNSNNLGNLTLTSLTFDSGADSFVLSGSSVTLGGNIAVNSGNAQIVNLGLNLGSTGRSVSGTNATLTLGGNITGAVVGTAVTFTGTGNNITLSGSNSFTGNVSFERGTLKIGSSTALGNGGLLLMGANASFDNSSAGALTLNNTLNLGLGATTTFLGSANLAFSGGLNITGGDRALNVSAGVLTVARVNFLQNNRVFTKSGSGTLVIEQGATAATGNSFSLAGGTVVLGNATALGTSSVAVFVNGATNISASTDLTGANKIVNNFTTTGTFSPTFTGTKSIEIGGSYNGTGSTVAHTSATITNSLTAGAQLILNNVAIKTTGSPIVSASSLDFAGNGNTLVQGTISNGNVYANRVIKSGSGTLTLTGSNSYTGNTTVNVGTLLINGSTVGDSAFSVSSGATLGGSGTIGGTVTVGSGGTLAPGNSPGNLTVNNSVTISDNATMSIEINGATVGSQYDRITMTTGTFSLTGTNNLALSPGYTPALDTFFFLVDNQGINAISGVFERLNGVTTDLSQGAAFFVSGQQFRISYEADLTNGTFLLGNDIVLQAIPEPSTWLLLTAVLTSIVILRLPKGCRTKKS